MLNELLERYPVLEECKKEIEYALNLLREPLKIDSQS